MKHFLFLMLSVLPFTVQAQLGACREQFVEMIDLLAQSRAEQGWSRSEAVQATVVLAKAVGNTHINHRVAAVMVDAALTKHTRSARHAAARELCMDIAAGEYN